MFFASNARNDPYAWAIRARIRVELEGGNAGIREGQIGITKNGLVFT